ncbi:MAG TPA: hypothetical protein O0X32_01010 [Methanocorpusculum sp.]|nr:hypothetical protein [Methanocorpusculum sp.]
MQILEHVVEAREGRFAFTLKITDPSGNSGIVSPKAKKTILDIKQEEGLSFKPYA